MGITDEIAVEMVAAEIETANKIVNDNIEDPEQFSDEILVEEIIVDEDMSSISNTNSDIDNSEIDISSSIDMNSLIVESSTNLPEELEGSGSLDFSLDFGDIQEV